MWIVAIIEFMLWPLAAMYHGFVLTILWGWFITPTFGVAVPGLWVAVGLAIMVGWLTTNIPDAEDDGTKLLARWLTGVAIRPTFVLGFSWLAHMLAS